MALAGVLGAVVVTALAVGEPSVVGSRMGGPVLDGGVAQCGTHSTPPCPLAAVDEDCPDTGGCGGNHNQVLL